MTKRFCDNCGSEIANYEIYYLEEIRAVNVITIGYRGIHRQIIVVSKRDLCVVCTPKAIDPRLSKMILKDPV